MNCEINACGMCHFLKCVRHQGARSSPTIPRDKVIKQVSKFYYEQPANSRKICILHTVHPTGSFARVRKKCSTITTPKHRTFHQNIPMSKESVTSEASVLCFFCVYSFPVCALWLVSAETSSAGESISRLKPVFQIIE